MSHIRNLLLHFENVEFMSNAVIGMLLGLRRRLQEAGGQLVLCRVGRRIVEVFGVARLDRVFTIVPDGQEGLQAFGVTGMSWSSQRSKNKK